MNRIDELKTSYLIPGTDLGTTAVADPEGFEEDYGDAPYSRLPAFTEIPSPNGVHELLGLNQVAPSPTQIDPPPWPAIYSRGAATANRATASLHLPANAPGKGTDVSASQKIERMKKLLASYDQTVRRIHARASGGGRQ